jgi:hypothetical protein
MATLRAICLREETDLGFLWPPPPLVFSTPMSSELMNLSAYANSSEQSAEQSSGTAREALAELRGLHAEMRTFLIGMFDRLDEIAIKHLDTASDHAAGQEAGQAPIDQLMAVAAELASLVTEQKQMLAQQRRQ